MYSKGDLSDQEMQRLEKLFDRNLETWEKDYSFTDESLDRCPGDSISHLLWNLSQDKIDNDLEQLNHINRLKQIAEEMGENSRISSCRNEITKSESESESVYESSDVESDCDKSPGIIDLTGNGDIGLDWWIKDPEYNLYITKSQEKILKVNTGSESWLSETLMFAAFQMLWKQFSEIDSDEFACPLFALNEGIKPFKERSCIQHALINGNHWICLDIRRSEQDSNNFFVKVYDSLGHMEVDETLEENLTRWLGKNKFKLSFETCAIQSDNQSCGLYAIAFAAEIYRKNDMIELEKFNSRLMRKHLHQCFQNRFISSFPKLIQ
jgi:hypothetical protein